MIEREIDWKELIGKNVFIRTKHGKKYSGKIKAVEERNVLIWIFLIDKFGKNVLFVDSEIIEIQEDKNDRN